MNVPHSRQMIVDLANHTSGLRGHDTKKRHLFPSLASMLRDTRTEASKLGATDDQLAPVDSLVAKWARMHTQHVGHSQAEKDVKFDEMHGDVEAAVKESMELGASATSLAPIIETAENFVHERATVVGIDLR
jgi:hypothetical protein